ncbi:hypothetical protein DFH28DRAFT_209429 [Melampsora americana]|nr:hypothetical protein DFH28DRAFT_209429 [Melampsora americana]
MTLKLFFINSNLFHPTKHQIKLHRRYHHDDYKSPKSIILPHLRTSMGQTYEKHVIEFMLKRFKGIQEIHHTGLKSSNDQGIDIKATWSLPLINTFPRKNPLRIISQCKDSVGELKFIRDLESNLISKSVEDQLIGILFTSRGFTLPALKRSQVSTLPILLIHLLSPRLHPKTSNQKEKKDEFVWLGAYPNQVATQILKPLRFVYGYSSDQSNPNDQTIEKKPVLWNSIQEAPWKD